MSAATATPTAPARATTPYRVTFGHLVRSEWIKIRTVRSTWWTAAVTIVIMGLMAFAVGVAAKNNPDVIHPWLALVFSVDFVALPVAVLAALSVTGEYGTGMIRSSLAAAPSRLPVLFAKTFVTAAVTLVLTVVGMAVSYVIAAPISGGIDFTDDAITAIIAMPIYLVLVSAIATAVGFLVRRSAAAISIMVVVLFVINVVVSLLVKFQDWAQHISPYMLTSLANRVIGNSDAPSVGVAWVLLAVWTVIPIAAAAVFLKTKDA